MKYYIAVNNQHQGPYSVDELRAMNIAPDTYVWREGMPSWVKATDVEEIRQAMVSPIPEMPGSVPPPYTGASTFNQSQYNSASQSGYSAPQSQQQPAPAVPPKTWLVESILVTILCCLPFGVVGIVKASETNQAINRGDYAAAERASKEAGKWTKIGFWVGIGVTVLYAIIYGIAIAIVGIGSATMTDYVY